jgi:sterol desaturase/sphingolipid hydroxylase (fatty acid hydroxylase superfamily)
MKIPERWLTDDCIAAAEGRPPRARGIQVFRSAAFERWLARAHPALPLALWGPIVATSVAIAVRGAPAGRVIGCFAAGTLVFSLFEYALHRFVFHRAFPDDRAGRIEAFLTHGYHHAYPEDPERLVMPPMASIPLGVLTASISISAFGLSIGLAAFAGFVTGYVLYDTTHFALHHWRPRTAIGAWMRRYHLLHHHAEEPTRFGVSSPLWDVVFRTFGPVGRAAAKLRRQAAGKA